MRNHFDDRARARSAVIEQLHRQVVEVAQRAGVTHGRRFRIDTKVVETNVHYPTDRSLLQDGRGTSSELISACDIARGQTRRITPRVSSVAK